MTAAELGGLPREQHRMCELVRGELRMRTPQGAQHGATAARLTARLIEFVIPAKLGVVFAAGTGFRIASDPDSVVAPDIAFVPRAEIPPTGVPAQYWNGAPTLAVEVIDAGQSPVTLGQRVATWLEAGALVVWVVRPHERTVTVHRTNTAASVLDAQQDLTDDDLLPGFRCPVAELFH